MTLQLESRPGPVSSIVGIYGVALLARTMIFDLQFGPHNISRAGSFLGTDTSF